jgi:hypothetical protein
MKARRLSWISVALTAGLLTMSTSAQEIPEITVEAVLANGEVVTLPTLCESQVLEIMRAVGAPTNTLGVPIVPRDVTLRLTGAELTSQTIHTQWEFGDLDFNRMDDPGVDQDLAPQVALDPVMPGAQRVRFGAPLQGQVLAIVDTRRGQTCINAAILEDSAPVRADILAEIETQIDGMQAQQELSSPGDTDIRERVTRVRADMRTVAVGLESYFVDCNAYPAWISGASEHSLSLGNSLLRSMPTFRRHEPGGLMTLTTPIAYLTSLRHDPFNRGSAYFTDEESVGMPVSAFSYFSDERGWILVSPGPDGDFDITPTLQYSSKTAQPSTDLVQRSYDPTNGTISGGDLFRVRQ